MREHHQKAIEKLTKNFEKKEQYLAILVVGSIAKGEEREDSDIDIILIVTDEEFEKRKQGNQFLYYSTRGCKYPNGYIDGKIINLQFLKDVAERGSEPARDAFRNAKIGFSRIPNLEALLKKITTYPKQEQKQKIQSFYAQFEVAKWFVEEAERRKDKYLLTHAVADMILYSGRLILAHNEIIYPYHKLLMNALRKAPDKPENLLELMDKLLEEPNSKNALVLYDTIMNFRKWNEANELWPIRFMLDTEWAWIDGKTYIGDI